MKRKAIEHYLENEAAFRDYNFHKASSFGKLSVKASINLLNPDQWELEDTLDTFTKDGYSTIEIYLGKVK